MKNIVLSAVAVLAMSSFAVAGGDIAPVEEPMVAASVITDGGFYLGLAYGFMGDEYTRSPNNMNPLSFDESYGAVMGQAGYKFNEYVAVEGRYWWAVSSVNVENNVKGELQGADAWGIYVKPMYPVTDSFDIYALLGYAAMDHNSVRLNDGDGFSWGLGASYGVTDSIDLFIDYVSIYDGDRSFTDASGVNVNKDISVDSVNFGVTYNF